MKRIFFLTAVMMMSASAGAADGLKVLCTTYPVYQIARNVVQGRDSVSLQLMLPANMGCPHDYALTPQDMQTLTGAKVLIVNGLGLEEFLGAPVKRVNPGLVVIDSSEGAKDLLQYSGEEHGHAEEKGGQHGAAANPHMFASPRMASQMAATIAAGLAVVDPAGAALYRKNAESYAARMSKLSEECAALGKILKNNRIVAQHGVFDYLARDIGLEVVAVLQAHAGQEPSAADMLAIVQKVRSEKAGAIFTEPQYPAKVGNTIAKETGIPVAVLDPFATGPDNAALDLYETVMRRNLETLRTTLGVKEK